MAEKALKWLKREWIGTAAVVTAICTISTAFLGCASVQRPMGGPKDTIAPSLVSAVPKSGTLNFKSEKVILNFSEYVKLQNQQKEFSLTPELAEAPLVKQRGKRIEVTFTKPLERNTTYTLNFGNAITDINESNVLKNFKYVFSTGSKLDSLSIGGTVTDGETGKPVNNATAFVVRAAQDTILGKHKPSIYSSTDSSGRFKITNLAPGSYKVYAIKEKDKGGDRIYQANTDYIAFIKEPVNLVKSVDSLHMVTFMEPGPLFRITGSKIADNGVITIALNRGLTNPQITAEGSAAITRGIRYRFNTAKDSAFVYVKNYGFDSLKFNVTDSGKVLGSTRVRREPTAKYNLAVTETDNIRNGLLNPYKRLEFKFSKPLASYNSTLVTLQEDSTEVKGFVLQGDSTNILKYTLAYAYKPGANYTIIFQPGALQGWDGGTNAAIERKFAVDKRENYGVLAVTLKAKDTSHPYVLTLLDANKNVLQEQPVKSGETVTYSSYLAGQYYLRVAYDTNGNGKWDTGNVKDGRQPERMYSVPKEMSIRGNWDRNETVEVP